jgi:hypothetical protein
METKEQHTARARVYRANNLEKCREQDKAFRDAHRFDPEYRQKRIDYNRAFHARRKFERTAKTGNSVMSFLNSVKREPA